MKDASIVWADDAQTGAARHISEVEIGLACHCVCTGCHATMEAVNPKNPNPKHRPHFRHDKAPILEDCARQAILKATIKTLMEATEIELPELRIKAKAVAQDGMEFEAEVTEQPQLVKIQNIEQVDVADVILTLEDGRQIYTRLIANAKWQTESPKQTQHAEFTIDISDESLWDIDPQKLRQQITLAPRMKRWCSHWHEDDLLTQAEALAWVKADEHWNNHLADEALGYTGKIKTEPASHYEWQPDDWQTGEQRPNPKPVKEEPKEYTWSNQPIDLEKIRKVAKTLRDGQHLRDAEQMILEGNNYKKQGETVESALEKVAAQFKMPKGNIELIKRAWSAGGIIVSF